MIDPSPVQASAQLLSRVLLVVQVLLGLQVGLAALGLALVWVVDAVREGVGGFLIGAAGYSDVSPTIWQSFGLLAVVLVQLLLLLAVTGRMRAIFVALRGLDADAAAQAARETAWWLWGLVVWGIAANALGSVIVTWSFPPGERALAVTIGSAQLMTALAALFAAFMAKALALGAALWRDYRAVI